VDDLSLAVPLEGLGVGRETSGILRASEKYIRY
jgi:hypothetical protein